MTTVVDTVNMSYHHGALREALIDSALALARAEGPEAVVLRVVSREAGVSHNAAYRHFADRDELLREVCSRCMAELAARMVRTISQAASTGSVQERAWARLSATGRAYVEFAVAEPGWFRTAFAVPLDASQQATSGLPGPYELLTAALDGLLDSGELSPGRRPGAEHAAWSAVHGLASLLVDGPLRDLVPAEQERALNVVLDVVAAGLAAPV